MPNAKAMTVKKRIYIQRDYTDGMVPKFQDKLPQDLDNIISPDVFQETIHHLNSLYSDAEKLTPEAYWEGTFACLTGYIFLGCMDTRYKKNLKNVKEYIKDQNKRKYWPHGVIVKDPFPTGLRSIEIAIYDVKRSPAQG